MKLKYGFLGFILGLLVYWAGKGKKTAKTNYVKATRCLL